MTSPRWALGYTARPPATLIALAVTTVAAGVGAVAMTSELLASVHATAVCIAVTVFLGVAAYRRTESTVGVLTATGTPKALALWYAVLAIMTSLDAGVPRWAAIAGTAVIVITAAACTIGRIYESGDVQIDAFSIRTAIDGFIIANAALCLFWFVHSSRAVSLTDYVTLGGNFLVAGIALARLGQEEHRRAGVALFAALLMGGAWAHSLHLGGIAGTLAAVCWAVGLAGQAWELPVTPSMRPNAQRVFEANDPYPVLATIIVGVGVLAVWRDKLPLWQTVTLGTVCLMLLGLRTVVSQAAETAVRTQVSNLVYADPLTGIGNRRALLDRLADGPGWVMSLDLDSFKSVNDQFGHEAGDIVLCRFVNRIQAILPKEADFFRIGGDEFAVVVSDKVRNIRALSRELVRCGSDPHHSEISVSVGLAPFALGDNPAGALRGSDIALQEAKRLGKNRAAVLDEEMLGERMRDLTIASRLRSGGLNDIYVVYQPLVAMGWPGAPIVGVEALARWHDRELGQIPPGEFVPICERQGMIPQLGLTVLRQSLEQLRVWMDEGRPIQISINVSVLQLRDDHVVAQMERLLAVEPELAKWIIIEVTESVFSDDDRAVNSLRKLRALGLCTALDDFGTGASTLTRLRHLPIDILKIDRSLVMGAGTDESADAILDMVATLGRRMDMVLVAEGLEDPLATNRCAELGYAVGQGFIFSRPLPANMLPDFARLQRPALPRRPMVDRLWTQSAMAVGGRPAEVPAYDDDYGV